MLSEAKHLLFARTLDFKAGVLRVPTRCFRLSANSGEAMTLFCQRGDGRSLRAQLFLCIVEVIGVFIPRPDRERSFELRADS